MCLPPITRVAPDEGSLSAPVGQRALPPKNEAKPMKTLHKCVGLHVHKDTMIGDVPILQRSHFKPETILWLHHFSKTGRINERSKLRKHFVSS